MSFNVKYLEYTLYRSSWSYINGNITQSMCAGEEDVLVMDGGQGDTYRKASVNVTLQIQPQNNCNNASLTPPQEPLTHCNEIGIWPITAVNNTINGTCYKGIFKGVKCTHAQSNVLFFHCTATRYCGKNGVWGSVMCMLSEEFSEIANEVSL